MLAFWDATGDVTVGWDAVPEDPALTAPTVTVTVFAEVTVTVAGPHPPLGDFPVIGDSVFPIDESFVLPPPTDTSIADLGPKTGASLAPLETGSGMTVTVLGWAGAVLMPSWPTLVELNWP